MAASTLTPQTGLSHHFMSSMIHRSCEDMCGLGASHIVHLIQMSRLNGCVGLTGQVFQAFSLLEK